MMADSEEAMKQAKDAYEVALSAGASIAVATAMACAVYRRWRKDLHADTIRETLDEALRDSP
jgi:tartrate dehydratase alpha subunit/fumarate hydratase class I-like protein